MGRAQGMLWWSGEAAGTTDGGQSSLDLGGAAGSVSLFGCQSGGQMMALGLGRVRAELGLSTASGPLDLGVRFGVPQGVGCLRPHCGGLVP
jgi:hypothetical protein